MSEQIEHDEEHPQRPSTILMQRIIAVVVLGVAFLVLGSVFAPADSSAADHHGEHDAADPTAEHDGQSDTSADEADSPASEMPTEAWGDVTLSSYSTDPHEGLAVVVSLESAHYRTVIYSTEAGLRYSVYERGETEAVGVLMDRQTLAARFPDLPAADLASGDVTQVMYVDPGDSLQY